MRRCVSEEVLLQLLADRLPKQEVHDVSAHLEQCAQCRALADRITDSPRLREVIRQCSPVLSDASDEHRLAPLVERLRRSGSLETPANENTSTGDGRLRPPSAATPSGNWASLGPYQIQGELGRGGMAIVFKAYDTHLKRVVAIKVPDRADARTRERFVREAQAAARIRHDNVVTVHAVEMEAGQLPYLVMEYVAGSTLRDRIADEGPLDPTEVARIGVDVSQGLAAAHRHGIVHRDVKPTNVLLDPETGRAQIADFGLARLTELPDTLSREGVAAGTYPYMSPEQVRGEQLTGRSDVYNLGVTLYEAMTGELPFQGTLEAVLCRMLGDEPEPPRKLNEAIPRDLETVCLKAMAKDPGRRYQTAEGLAADLRRFLNGEPITARPVGRLERAWRWCRRKPAIAALSAALLLSLVGGGSVGFHIRNQVRADRAAALVDQVLNADVSEVLQIVGQLEPYRGWADRELNNRLVAGTTHSQVVNIRLALLPLDPTQVEPLSDAMLQGTPEQVDVIRASLLSHHRQQSAKVTERLWQLVQNPQSNAEPCLRAASALAAFDPKNPNWAGASRNVAAAMSDQSSVSLAPWVQLLQPVRAFLHEEFVRLSHQLVEEARDHTRHARWQQAGTLHSNAIELGCDDVEAGHELALIQLQHDDTDGYRDTCRRLLERFGQTDDPKTANVVAWTCVLVPGAVTDSALPVKLARTAVGSDPEGQMGRWQYLNTLGATLYRADQFREAVACLVQSVEAMKPKAACEDCVFLAMANHRAGDADEARKWLNEAMKFRNDGRWQERQEIDRLRREAQNLILANGSERERTGP